MPAGYRSFDDLAKDIRTISNAVGDILQQGPLKRRIIELILLDMMPGSGKNKVGIRAIRHVLDALTELEEFACIPEGEEDED